MASRPSARRRGLSFWDAFTLLRTTRDGPGLHLRLLDHHDPLDDDAVGYADRLVTGLERHRRRVDPEDLAADVVDADGLADLEVGPRVAAAAQRARDLASAEPERQRHRDGDRAGEQERDRDQRTDAHPGLGRRAQREDGDDDDLDDRSDRDREVELRGCPLRPGPRHRADDDPDQDERQRREQLRDVEDGLVERVAEELKAEEGHRREAHDNGDRQPHSGRDERRERASKPALGEQRAGSRAIAETVEPGAHQRLARDAPEDARDEQADEDEKQRADDPGQERAELIARALDHRCGHGRHRDPRVPNTDATASASAARKPPSALSGTASARCARARAIRSALKRELRLGVSLPTSRSNSIARDSAPSGGGLGTSLIAEAPSRMCWHAASRRTRGAHGATGP